MYGLRQRLSERRSVFRFRQTGGRRSENDQEKLFFNMERRDRGRSHFSGEFFSRLGRIPTRADADGTRSCDSDDVSRAQNNKIVHRQKFIVLQI